MTDISNPSLDELETRVNHELDRLCRDLGEHHIGGSRHPGEYAFHRQDKVNERGKKWIEPLKVHLTNWSRDFGLVPTLCVLWERTYDVLQVTIAYNALAIVDEAAAAFVEELRSDKSIPDWEFQAAWAVSKAMKLIINDGDLFKWINLSDADEVKKRAEAAAETARDVSDELEPLLKSAAGRDTKRLEGIQDTADQMCRFDQACGLAASAVLEFEKSLMHAPVSNSLATSSGSVPLQLGIIDEAVEDMRCVVNDTNLEVLREICEPWERLLVEIREIVTTNEVQCVFVPKSAKIRYCYPFAVESDEHRPPWGYEENKSKLTKALANALGHLNIAIGQPKPLGASQFFHRDVGKYGGLRVDLQGGITFRHLPLPGVEGDAQGVECEVWLDLSDTGNHCLCIQLPALVEPRPHQLYRIVRAGTPFVTGETVVAKPRPVPDCDQDGSADTEKLEWDTLHSFCRDVVVAIAKGMLPSGGDLKFDDHFEPGNLHEVVVVQTNAPPRGAQPRDIAAELDRAVGGRLLLRSTHQAASTLAEWVRYPSPSHGRSVIEGAPVLGLAGDWFTNTGEITVFGFLASPNWHTDVYIEAAQFASSWSPLLRLWSRRLQNEIRRTEPDADKQQTKSDAGKTEANQEAARALRKLERRVRLHLMWIWAEDLTATRTFRRFLDRLLEIADVADLQKALEAQLVATEHLTDWFDKAVDEANEGRRQQTENRRNVLLAFIALFGLLGLSGFLSVATSQETGPDILGFLPPGVWEEWALLGLFMTGLAVGIWFDIFAINNWVKTRANDWFNKLGKRADQSDRERGTT